MNRLKAFFTHAPAKSFYDTTFYKKYIHSLHLFWHGQGEEATAYVCDVIEQHADHMHIHLFYRLWIEILAQSKEFPSLHMLLGHLLKLGNERADVATWASLRGLIHLELDELDGCFLIARSLKGQVNNPYYLELRQKMRLRSNHSAFTRFPLLQCQGPVIDYFHWETLCAGLLVEKQVLMLGSVLTKASKIFEESPLKDLYGFYQHLDHGHLKEAGVIAGKLSERFPKRSDYAFLKGWVAACLHDFKKAASAFGSTAKLLKANQPTLVDPEVTSLLGYSHLMNSQEDPKNPEWSKAKASLQEAKKQLLAQALPTDHVDMQLRSMEQKEHKQKPKSNPSPRAWVLFLSPRRWEEYDRSRSEDIEILHQPLGLGVLAGDEVFVVAKQKFDKQQPFRVLALYRVDTDAYWHPFHKAHSQLEVELRFQRAIRADKSIFESAQGGAGVYLLSPQGLGTMRRHIQEQQGDDLNVQRVMERHWKFSSSAQSISKLA